VNLAELQEKVVEAGLYPKIVVVATREEDFDEWSFNVVPQADGTFIVKRTDGRGGWTTVVDDVVSLRPRVFTSEEELCSWLWEEIVKSRLASVPVVRTPEQAEAKRRRIEENLRRINERFSG